MNELLNTPIKDLPQLCKVFLVQQTKQYGMREPVVRNSIAAYLQGVESLTCDDPCYQISDYAKKFFGSLAMSPIDTTTQVK